MTSTEGPKTEDSDFINILLKSTIFCLEETKREVFIPNYECFNSTRSDSRSGGVCIGIHRSLSGRAKLLKTNCPDFQAVTIYPQDEDKFTIINVYDSPEHSSYKAKRKAFGNDPSSQLTTLELLQEFREQSPNIGEVLMVGDFNARTAYQNISTDELESEIDTEYPMALSYAGKSLRTSKDSVLNNRGSLFLDFLASNSLQILNGCSLGDIFGDFTSINYNGCSVVDYMAATPNLKEEVLSFKVLELTKLSDHKPCLCTIKRTNTITDASDLLETLEDVPTRYKWNHETEETQSRFFWPKTNLNSEAE